MAAQKMPQKMLHLEKGLEESWLDYTANLHNRAQKREAPSPDEIDISIDEIVFL